MNPEDLDQNIHQLCFKTNLFYKLVDLNVVHVKFFKNNLKKTKTSYLSESSVQTISLNSSSLHNLMSVFSLRGLVSPSRNKYYY